LGDLALTKALSEIPAGKPTMPSFNIQLPVIRLQKRKGRMRPFFVIRQFSRSSA
jgi:hypothetical protein